MSEQLPPTSGQAQPPQTAPAGGSPPTATPPSQPAAPTTPPTSDPGRTRASTTYVGIGIGLLVLIVIIIFFVQNLHETSVHFITLKFRLPTGVVVLASAVAGGLVVLLASVARVVQFRRAARRSRKAIASL